MVALTKNILRAGGQITEPMSENREYCCPSCGQRARFTFCGYQEWPEAVAKAAGLPRVVALWNCTRCKSTVSENSLK